MTQRLKLTVAYLGDRFCGWQRQPDQRSVQGELERAFRSMTDGVPVSLVGAGRTDAGVHAAGQVAHLDLEVAIPTPALLRGLNRRLPPDVRIRSVRPVAAAFHARRSALAKHYAYRVRWRPPELPWQTPTTAVVNEVTRLDALGSALAQLKGTHDMASFTVPEAAARPTERTLFRAWLERRRVGMELHFVGNGFLRYQVRRMVAALLEVGRDRRTLAAFQELLRNPRPGAPLPTAPARGLTLERVFYRRSRLLTSSAVW